MCQRQETLPFLEEHSYVFQVLQTKRETLNDKDAAILLSILGDGDERQRALVY